MRASNVLGIIYASVDDDKISELTAVRTIGSVPFAGRYRLIDFALSNMVNAGITAVGVSTKSNYRSLMDHLGAGKPWDLARKRDGLTILPPFDLAGNGGVSRTRIEALQAMLNYMGHSHKDYVLLADANVVATLDYEALMENHEKSGADITIAYKRGQKPRLPDIMTFVFADGDRIKRAVVSDNGPEDKDYSLNVLFMKRALLERLVANALTAGATEFEKDIINANCDKLYIRGEKIEGFACTIDSLQTYYDVSMKLVDGQYKGLFQKDLPVYTKVRDDMPAIYGTKSRAANSLIADGCIIKGTVENSILFRGVYVAEGATVKNSVLMQDSYISEGASVNCAVLDKNVVIKPNKELSGAATCPLFIGKDVTV